MSKPLRLLHQIHLANDVWGGMEKQFANLLLQTAGDARVEHYLIEDLRGLAPGVRAALPALKAQAADARRWHGLAIPNWRGLRQSRQRRIARHWDIDTVLSWNRFGDPRPAQLAQRLGARSVYWERGAAWFARHRVPDVDFLSGFDRYLANSKACAAMLRHWGVKAPIEICRPGIRVERATPAQARVLDGSRPLTLGFCARLQSFKGGVLVLHALRELRSFGIEARLLIAGDGPERANLQALSARLDVNDRTEFLGRLDDTDSFYSRIDLLVHPALREPYGNVCAEALSLGIPVVAAAVDGLPEVVDHELDGLCVVPTLTLADFSELGGDVSTVYPRVYRPELDRVAEPGAVDPLQLAEAVLAIAADAQRYRRYSESALAGAANKFSYPAHVDRLFELLAPREPPTSFNCRDQTRPAWQDRALKACALIEKAIEGRRLPSVADIGCGDRKLSYWLMQQGIACRYQGYDLVPQSAAVQRLDIQSQSLPASHDVVVMLGVSEYLASLPRVLTTLRRNAGALVISHTIADQPRSAEELHRLGWTQHLTRALFEQTLVEAGWRVVESVLTDDGKTVIWRCAC